MNRCAFFHLLFIFIYMNSSVSGYKLMIPISFLLYIIIMLRVYFSDSILKICYFNNLKLMTFMLFFMFNFPQQM